MSKVAKTLDRIIRGNSDASIRFDDLRAVLVHLGFTERIRGDHHIFTRDGVPEILNLQPRGSQAKAYQVKQVRGVIVAHRLAVELEENTTVEGPQLDVLRPSTREGEGNGQ
ncbi:MAG: type II toxin-antitoxin system HicA family toxin [Isosphaeraceae bacterium]